MFTIKAKVNFEIYSVDGNATTYLYIGKAFSAPLCHPRSTTTNTLLLNLLSWRILS